jgi:mannose-6-phosphate isomerase-like protein (cupin superfamily)
VVNVDSQRTKVFSKQKKVYSFIGLEDVELIDTVDATLVIRRGHSQKVKNVIDELLSRKDSRAEQHQFEVRPWGRFDVLADRDDFKSKIIEVDAGQQLSYQSHNQRAEHWIIVEGQGEVVLDDKVIPVRAGSYVFIPLQAKHRMRNTGTQPLKFVEVQTGSYFGEDDIIRYQDDYKRV